MRQEDNKMAEASATLSWEDVKKWMDQQKPHQLQLVLKTASNLLVPHCNNSEHSAAEAEDADKFEDKQENAEADAEEYEARAQAYNEKENGIKKTASNKVALEDVNETLVEEYISQERAIFGGDAKFHNLVSESLKEGKAREDILVAQRTPRFLIFFAALNLHLLAFGFKL